MANNSTSQRRSGPTPVSPERRSKGQPKQKHFPSKQIALSSTPNNFTVEDIGGSSLPRMLTSMLHENLLTSDTNGKRLLSSPFLSDDLGLKIWSKITHLPDYYQTRDEIELLERCGGEIIRSLGIDNGTEGNGLIVLDLGAGDIRKVIPLLAHLDTLKIPITYYALDLSHPILFSAMEHLRTQNFKNIASHGLWGTFDSALSFVQTLPPNTPRLFLSLGSSFGNDFHEPAVERLKAWRNEMRPHDRMLLGMDGTTDLNDIWASYHPPNNLFEKFMRNGLLASNRVLNIPWYKRSDWEVEGVLTSEPYIMHRFVFTAKREVRCERLGLVMKRGEKIDCYEAFKYGVETMRKQFSEAGLMEMGLWKSETGRINQYLLCKDASIEPQYGSNDIW